MAVDYDEVITNQPAVIDNVGPRGTFHAGLRDHQGRIRG